MNNEKKIWSTQTMIYTAMLAALAGVLMSLEISVPMMPPFYKVDFSDVPSVIALFLLGPVPAAAVEVIKVLIKLVTVGTNSMYVGEFANLIGIVLFVVPIWLVYKKMGKTIVLVTHDPKVASYCDKIILLKDGMILNTLERNGEKKEFYQKILRQMVKL